MTDAAAAARYNVRPLLPGPESALREAVLALGGSTAQLSAVAKHGAAEALAVENLAPDQTRLLQRFFGERVGTVLTDQNGGRAVLLGPLTTVSALPAHLADGSETTTSLGEAIGAVLMERSTVPPLHAGDVVLRCDQRTQVMGVLNVTPDSFSGDAVGVDPVAALHRARQLSAEGADIIDVGGESTRPHAQPISADEEEARVVPAVHAIASELDVPVSVDTRKASVAAAAIEAGARMVNDVWGLRGDSQMASVLAAHPTVALVAMHNHRGTSYTDLMAEVCASLRVSLRIAEEHHLDPRRIAIDPGFGFAKTPAQNLELVRRLAELRGLGRPILIGPSRKHTIGVLVGGGRPAALRVEGTLAMVSLAVAAGASLVRVHDVRQTVDAVRVADAVARGTPAALCEMPAPGPTG